MACAGDVGGAEGKSSGTRDEAEDDEHQAPTPTVDPLLTNSKKRKADAHLDSFPSYLRAASDVEALCEAGACPGSGRGHLLTF